MSASQPFSSIAEKGGLWRIEAGRLVCLKPSSVAPAVVQVPSEQVLTLAVDLPLPTRRQRLAALPFAIEDRLADPLEAVHVALGVELAPRRYLVGVVRHDVMADWIARLDEAGLGRCALTPDAFVLPSPEAGAWSVQRTGERVLVRTADGPGFALPAAMLGAAWEGAGRPLLFSSGAPLPSGIPSVPDPADPYGLSTRLLRVPLDLRQGRYSGHGRPVARLLRRLAIVVGVGAFAHAAIAAADTAALHRVAHERHDRALALLRQAAPNIPADADPVSELDRLLPAAGGGPSGFFPLLTRTSAALQPVREGLAVHSLAYAAGDGALSLNLEAADMAGLQRVQAALAGAGLSPSAGAATAESGHASGEFVVRGARGGR